MDAVYVSSNQFTVSGDHTSEFLYGRRLKADCGVDGYKYSTIQSSSFSSPNTTVTIEESVLTSNLSSVLYGLVSPGEEGSLPIHKHDGTEGHGGRIDFTSISGVPTTYENGKYLKATASGTEWVTISEAITTLLELSDTPSSYDEGKYLISTASGSAWATVSGADSGVSNFLELTDTPSTYSDGQYLRSTASGIEWVTISGSSSGATDLVSLADTPESYDEGKYLRSTASGTEWATISGGSAGATTFLELTDTPSTYSGSVDKYLVSTGSGIGWVELEEGVTTFIELEDTPSTYSGGTDIFLKATSTGTEWGTYTDRVLKYYYESNVDTNAFTNYEKYKLGLLPEKFQFLTGSGIPASGTEANFNDVFYSSTTETLYKKEQGSFISSSFTEESNTLFFSPEADYTYDNPTDLYTVIGIQEYTESRYVVCFVRRYSTLRGKLYLAMITYDPETDTFTTDATFDCSDEVYDWLYATGYYVTFSSARQSRVHFYITQNKDLIILGVDQSGYPRFMKYRFDSETNDFVFVYKERFTSLRYWNELMSSEYNVMIEYQEDKCLIFCSENIDDDTETKGPAYKMDFSGDTIVYDGYDLLDHAVHAMVNVSGDRYLTISYTEGDLNARVMDVDTTDGSLSFGSVSSFSGVGSSGAAALYKAILHKINENLFYLFWQLVNTTLIKLSLVIYH
jgi:hypothetical protein